MCVEKVRIEGFSFKKKLGRSALFVVCRKLPNYITFCNKAKLIGFVEKVPSVAKKSSVLDKSGFG